MSSKTALLHSNFEDTVSVEKLGQYGRFWLQDCEFRQLSSTTIANRKLFVEKLAWFLRKCNYTECGIVEIKEFLAYVGNGHEDEGGRWGNKHLINGVRPRTSSTYFTNLRTFFRYLVDENVVDVSPVEFIRPPQSSPDQIQPFTESQVSALLRVARKSKHPRRDEAILLLLLDTGIRASELCSLRMRDIDMDNRQCTVMGKGNKRRRLPFGSTTRKALWQYLQEEPRDEESFLFLSDRGNGAGEGLTRSGLLQLIERLGKTAGIRSVRCSPHTFRHTFAVEFLTMGYERPPLAGTTSRDKYPSAFGTNSFTVGGTEPWHTSLISAIFLMMMAFPGPGSAVDMQSIMVR